MTSTIQDVKHFEFASSSTEKPYIVKHPEDKVRYEGGRVLLCCKATGSPPPDKYYWWEQYSYDMLGHNDHCDKFWESSQNLDAGNGAPKQLSPYRLLC